jgi:hypothetical protein
MAGAMHEEGAVLGASQKNARGRISIARTGRFRTAMTPLIDFSDSDYKVGAFRGGFLGHNGRNEVVGWGLCLGKSGPHFKCGLLCSCAIKKKLMAISVRPLPKASGHHIACMSLCPLTHTFTPCIQTCVCCRCMCASARTRLCVCSASLPRIIRVDIYTGGRRGRYKGAFYGNLILVGHGSDRTIVRIC